MTKNEIVGQLAQRREVEKLVGNICRCDLPEMQDLCQMIYLALLEKEEDAIVKAYEEGWLKYKIVRMILNQWYSDRSPFRLLFDKYKMNATEINDRIREYEQDWLEVPRYIRSREDIQGG